MNMDAIASPFRFIHAQYRFGKSTQLLHRLRLYRARLGIVGLAAVVTRQLASPWDNKLTGLKRCIGPEIECILLHKRLSKRRSHRRRTEAKPRSMDP